MPFTIRPFRCFPVPWRVKREICANGSTRVRRSGFDVPKTSNFGPRTLASRLSRPAILQGRSVLVPDVQAIEVLLCRNGFSAAC
jgi:hypothetical protein